VVPCDISLKAGHAIVISGPNAGGKTVSLKTLGLCALMLRAGLPVPAQEHSELGFVVSVLTDVGDDQSIAHNLSTFSAHVKNLAHILEQAQPGVLVLLDEICTGTDPREGEALAAGVLDSLLKRGAAVFATTHYEGLKALALGDARFQNASYAIDVATMAPTFRLALGVPGSSSALQVAKRFGMPSTVLERAARFLSREDLRFEELVQKLHEERAALELARAFAEQSAQDAERTRAELKAEIERVRARGHHEIEEGVRHLTVALQRAREDLRSAQGRLRQKKPEPGSLKEAERALDNVAREIGVGGALGAAISKSPEGLTPVAVDKLKKGMRVWVPRLRAHAEIIMLHGAEVRVAAGPLKLTVGVHEIMASAPDEAPAAAPSKPRLSDFKESPEVPIQTSDNTCDVRGLRTDDAVSMVLSFLDRSVGENRRVAFIVHGHGTGALRDALRAELADSPYAQGMRPGGRGEGGDGVTIVWLK
jgi:DNA mismatch repair protein MutS2